MLEHLFGWLARTRPRAYAQSYGSVKATDIPSALAQYVTELHVLPPDAYLYGPDNSAQLNEPQWVMQTYHNEAPPSTSATFRQVTDGAGNVLPNLQ